MRPSLLLEIVAACASIGALVTFLALFGTNMGIGLLVAIVVFVIVGLEFGLVPALLERLVTLAVAGRPRGWFASLWVTGAEELPSGSRTPGRESAPDNPTLR